jgi:protocatechuate 3,4-dioxygenase beta subunit
MYIMIKFRTLSRMVVLSACLCAAIGAAGAADAISPPDKYLAKDCVPTPQIAKLKRAYPGGARIIPSNKLAIPAGKSILAAGQLVYVTGRVLDEHCVPVPDAVVDIWQANPEGQYTILSAASRANPYPGFAGTGRAVTDNLGRFTFITLFPGPYDDRAPHIDFRVAHPHFPTLYTEMFFGEDRRNADDPDLRKIPADRQALLTANVAPANPMYSPVGIEGYFDITLAGNSRFKHY